MYSIEYSTKNGLGRPAVSIYFSGCDKEIKCPGCHNEELWEKQDDILPIELVEELIDSYSKIHKNLMISIIGGEPFAEYNREEVVLLTAYLKRKFPQIPIVVYSWRTLSEIDPTWIKYIDYGVLGAYDSTKHIDNCLPASSNQEIWDFKKMEKLEPIKLV